MPTLKPLLLLFAASAIAGGLRSFWLLVTRRRVGLTLPALHVWTEKPLPSWRYEPYSAAAVLVHKLAILVLGVAALSAATKPTTFAHPLYSNDISMVILSWISEGGSMGLVGYIVGSLVVFPRASLRRVPVAMAITEDGMVHGSTLLPWRWFSHFSIDFRGGVLRLYSAFSPDLPALISKPPASTPLGVIGEALQEYLPRELATDGRAWYRTKHLLVPTMILVCIPLVAAGWLAADLPRVLALFSIALFTVILVVLGGRVLSLFGFGFLKIKANTPPPPPAA